MSGPRWLAGGALIAGAWLGRAEPTILVPGMELQYEANGQPGSPWRVESVERDLAVAGREGCLRVRFAPGGPRPGPDVRTTCESDGVLWSLDSVSGSWRRSRPLVVGGTLELPTGPRRARYSVSGEGRAVIGGHALRYLETTVLTVDSAGVALRRLREHYAPAVGTALWGAFEVPDGDGWTVQQEFRLTAIRPAKPGG